MDSSILTHKPTGREDVTEVSEILEHTTAIRKVIDILTDKENGVLGSVDEIQAVGHRVVHGGKPSRNPHSLTMQRRLKFAACSIWHHFTTQQQ